MGKLSGTWVEVPETSTAWCRLHQSDWWRWRRELGRMECLTWASVCVLPAGMGPAVLEKWQPQQTTLTAQSELLSMPRSEVWETTLGRCRTPPELETGLCWQGGVQLLPKMAIVTCVIKYSPRLLKQYAYSVDMESVSSRMGSLTAVPS